jgi:hypothetical protein
MKYYGQTSLRATKSEMLNRQFLMAIKNCHGTQLEARIVNAINEALGAERGKVLAERFSWDGEVKLRDIFRGNFTISIDRLNEELIVNIPTFNPRKKVTAPNGATHFRLIIACIETNGQELDVEVRFSKFIEYADKVIPNITAVLPIRRVRDLTIITCMAIKWLREENGNIMELKDCKYNMAELVDLDQATGQFSRIVKTRVGKKEPIRELAAEYQ